RARGAGEAALDHLGHDAPGAAGRSHAPRLLEARERVVDVMLVAGQVGRDAAGIAAALHVVLAAKRRDAAARTAYLAGHEREVQQRVGVVDAVDVLGDAHAPDQAGAGKRRLRVPARGLRDVARGDAGDPLGVVQRVGLERAAPGGEAPGSLAGEAA